MCPLHPPPDTSKPPPQPWFIQPMLCPCYFAKHNRQEKFVYLLRLPFTSCYCLSSSVVSVFIGVRCHRDLLKWLWRDASLVHASYKSHTFASIEFSISHTSSFSVSEHGRGSISSQLCLRVCFAADKICKLKPVGKHIRFFAFGNQLQPLHYINKDVCMWCLTQL